MHPPLFHKFNTEVNNLNIAVTLLVIYRQDQQIILQHLEKLAQEHHCLNRPVSYGNLGGADRKGYKNIIIPSHILKKGAIPTYESISPKQSPEDIITMNKQSKPPTKYFCII